MAELLNHVKEEMTMDMKRKLLGAVALFAMFAGMEANAQGTSQNINVQADVPNVCVINGSGTALSIDFGTVDITGLVDSTDVASLTWRCSAGTNVEIRLDAGDTPGSDPATARLLEHGTDPTETLDYLLCQDAACVTPWGDETTAADVDAVGAGMAAPQNTQIFGVLDANSGVSAIAGIYTETVVVSLVF